VVDIWGWDEDPRYDEPNEPDWDGDQCPNCGRLETMRIDTISNDPTIWICQCAVCGATFEALGGASYANDGE